MSDVCNQHAGSEIDNKLGKAVFAAGLPFRMVKNVEFKKYGKLRQRASESYIEPSADKISGSILNNVQRELKFELQERNDAAALRTGVTINLAGEVSIGMTSSPPSTSQPRANNSRASTTPMV